MNEADSGKRTIEQLHRVALQLAKARSEQEVCELTLEAAEEILSFDLSSVGLVDGEWLRVRTVSNGLEIVDIPRTSGLAGFCLRTGESVVVADVQTDPRANPLKTCYRGAMSIPIDNRGVFQAVSYTVDAFTQEDVRLAELLVAHTLAALERLDYEIDLQQREQQLNKLSQQVPGMIYQYCYHPDGRSWVPFASDGIWDIYEVTPDDVKEDATIVYSRIHPEDYDRVVASVGASFASLMVWDCEYRVVLPKKGQRWVRGTARPEKLPDDSVLWHGYLTDVTGMKATETALQDSTEKYKALVSNVPGAIFQCRNDTEWTMEFISREVETMVGYSAEDFIQNRRRSYASLIHEEDRAAVSQGAHSALARQKPYTLEYRIVHADGSIRWIRESAQGVFSSDGELHYIYGILTDVTVQKRMELALRESEERFRALYENSPVSIVIHDKDTGEIVDANAAALRSYGVSSLEALQGHSFWLEPPYSEADALALVHRAVKEGSVEFDWQSRNASGAIFWEHVHLAAVRVNGKVRVLSTSVDITERTEAEEKLIEYTTELELRGSELNALYRVLNHEMESAQSIHKRLMQQQLPSAAGISLAAACTPATYIGGDFYQVVSKGGKTVIYISDVTGHGLDGTMFSLFVKTTIDSFIELTPIDQVTPSSVLKHLDSQLRKGVFPSEYAVAISVMVFASDTKELNYSAAGFQNAPILVTDDGVLEMLASRGLPISRDIPEGLVDFEEHRRVLPDHALLFAATDGLYEQLNEESTMYEQRLTALLEEASGLPEQTIIDLVQTDFDEFRGNKEQADDTTLVVLSTAPNDAFAVASTLESLEDVRRRTTAYYQDHPDCEGIAMAVHELAANAIEHGNQLSADTSVHIQLSPNGLVVEDEGDGFDWRERITRKLGLGCQERGRGIVMVQMLVGQLVYNEKGNRVSLAFEKGAARMRALDSSPA